MRIAYSTANPKSFPTEIEAITDRLVASGYAKNEVGMAVALMRSGRTDLLARVISGELDVPRAWRIARSR
jgi:hypothetical protein